MAEKIDVRRAKERFHTDISWLDSWHSFSFGEHYDPKNTHHGLLLVLNDDVVAAGGGFGTHPHRDMEIVTYVLDGGLQHRDSMGNGSVIRPGEVQKMTAGMGITHSEFNASRRDGVHFLQIWIEPLRNGLAPSYQQKEFSSESRRGVLRLVASRDGRDGSILVHQDANLYASTLETGQRVAHRNAAGRHVWIQVARGAVAVNGVALAVGDGASTDDPGALTIAATAPAEFLLFDLA